MTTTIAVVGAGGKMGRRASERLGQIPEFVTLNCEKDPRAAAMLQQEGLPVTEIIPAVSQADFVILAVPDEAIGAITHSILPALKPGCTLISLDAAAAYIGEVPARPGITQMITHPCHPALFGRQETEAARSDHFGGTAVQDILVCLVDGSEEAFAHGTELCRILFAPVRRAHRVTLEQFAFLEPAMSEMIVATAATFIRASLDAAVERGVPREAAESFMAGHVQIALAIVFGAESSPFSDACKVAIEWGTRELIDPEWRRVFDRPVLSEAIREMIRPQSAPEEVNA